jgi:hypothetical protein
MHLLFFLLLGFRRFLPQVEEVGGAGSATHVQRCILVDPELTDAILDADVHVAMELLLVPKGLHAFLQLGWRMLRALETLLAGPTAAKLQLAESELRLAFLLIEQLF